MNSSEKRKLLFSHINSCKQNGRLSLEKSFFQHGTCSVYKHSVSVALESISIADRLGVHVDYKSLVRGALLHDYFLYDWHTHKNKIPFTHGFTHPFTALKNAKEDFNLSRREIDIITHHMFPLIPLPPLTKEGWIVCLADKLCAVHETVKRKKKRHERVKAKLRSKKTPSR